MLGASCILDVSEMVLTKYENPDETEGGTTMLHKWFIQFWCLNGVSVDGIKTMFKVYHDLVLKGIILTPWLKWEWVSDDTLPVKLG